MTDRYSDGSYAAAHPAWHAEDAPVKADAVWQMMTTLSWSPDHILDVGCGTGDVLRGLGLRLRATGRSHVRLEGWDVSPDVAARWQHTSHIELHHGDPVSRDRRADLALALDVSEHVEDDVSFLAGITHLAPRVILRMPLDRSWLGQLRPERSAQLAERYGHVHAYTRRAALTLVQRAGLQVVHTQLDRVDPRIDTPRRAVVERVRRVGHRWAPGLTADVLGGWSLVVAAVV